MKNQPEPTKLTQEQLEDLLRDWSDKYYNGDPVVDDSTFDSYYAYLEGTYPESNFLQEVGAPVKVSNWEKARHEIPMTSLDKVHKIEDVQKWGSSIGAKKFWLTEKLDGISIELIYEDGKLVAGITRGNGKIGEDILVNVKRMKNVKSSLGISFSGSIRGEIILRKSQFAQLIDDNYSNPRNAASGIARRYDGRQANYLEILFYDIISYGDDDFTTEQEKHDYIANKLNLKALDGSVVSISSAKKIYEEYQDEKRSLLDYEIDGLVLKVNDLALVNKIDSTVTEGHNPKSQRAWKFEQPFGVSTLREIIWSTGKAGSITPIAIFDEIPLAGAKVKMASMHNVSIAKELNVNVGDKIKVIRANDVIPQVVGVEEKINKESIEIPTKCGICNEILKLETSAQKDRTIETLFCVNDLCPGTMVGKIVRLIEVLEIKDFSEARVQSLFDSKIIKDPADLFSFDEKDAIKLDGFGEKIISRFKKQLLEKSKTDLAHFLACAGIRTLGVRQWSKITNAGYESWEQIEELLKLQKEEFIEKLDKIKGLGVELLSQMYDGLNKSLPLIEKLLNHMEIISIDRSSGKLNGLNICMTGLRKYNGIDLVSLIEQEGGNIRNSVSKNLDLLVVADINSSSSKLKKAKANDVQIIEVEAFFEKYDLC